jgi:hypothetical protein
MHANASIYLRPVNIEYVLVRCSQHPKQLSLPARPALRARINISSSKQGQRPQRALSASQVNVNKPIKGISLTPLSGSPLSPIEEAAADRMVGYWVARGCRCEIQPEMATFLMEVLRANGFTIGHSMVGLTPAIAKPLRQP